MKKIVIIGGGAVGMGVASKISRTSNNYEIFVVQKENYISLGQCGMPYYVGNDFDNSNLLNDRTTSSFKDEKIFKSKINFLLEAVVTNVNTKDQIVTYRNKNKEEILLKYDFIVIATGAKPNVFLPFNTNDLIDNCYILNNKNNAIKIKEKLKKTRKVTIIGGSYIGLEVAEACWKQKKHVTIVETQSRLLANILDEELHPYLLNHLKQTASNLFDLYLNNSVKDFVVKNKKITKIILSSGTKIETDLVILATGIEPNTEFLRKNNFLFFKNKALLINKYCQALHQDNVTKPYDNVFSGGDCATIFNQTSQEKNYIALATTANKIARIIANNILKPNNLQKFPGTLGSSAITINNLEIVVCGINDASWKNQIVKSVTINDQDLPKYFNKSMPLIIKIFYNQETYQILRAQMLGFNHATLRINALAIAIWKKMDVRELADIDFIYAPPFARTVDILQLAARKIITDEENKNDSR